MGDKEKKRKRHSLETDKPNKRKSVGPSDSSNDDISVSLLHADQQLCPVVASTPGLQLKSLAASAYSKTNTAANANSIPAPDTHSILLHTSEHPHLDYTAQSDADQKLSHYVAVFDPSKKALEIVPAHAVTVRSTLRSEKIEVDVDNALRSKAMQREALGMEFGTKKAKRAIASKTVNAITGESAKGVESAIMESVKEAANATQKRDEREDEILKSKPIPQPDLKTDKVEEIYPLARLIPKQDLQAMTVQDWIDKTEAGEAIVFHHRFVANRVQLLVKQNNIPKLKALKYLLLLLEFVAALRPGKSGRKLPQKEQLKEKLSDWTDGNIDSVRRRFAEGAELNKWHMDNLMTHIAAISLFIDSFRTDTHDLREDLRLENKQMSQYFSELGCKIRPPTEKEFKDFKISNKAQAAQRKVAVLRLPLEFPKTRNPPKRR